MKVIKHSFRIPENTLVLPWWQTPKFCMVMLDEIMKFDKRKNTGSKGSTGAQIARYQAIATGQDWDTKRNWPVVWMMPSRDVEVSPHQILSFPDWRETLGNMMIIKPR